MHLSIFSTSPSPEQKSKVLLSVSSCFSFFLGGGDKCTFFLFCFLFSHHHAPRFSFCFERATLQRERVASWISIQCLCSCGTESSGLTGTSASIHISDLSLSRHILISSMLIARDCLLERIKRGILPTQTRHLCVLLTACGPSDQVRRGARGTESSVVSSCARSY
jgi:hypothetical protein